MVTYRDWANGFCTVSVRFLYGFCTVSVVLTRGSQKPCSRLAGWLPRSDAGDDSLALAHWLAGVGPVALSRWLALAGAGWRSASQRRQPVPATTSQRQTAPDSALHPWPLRVRTSFLKAVAAEGFGLASLPSCGEDLVLQAFCCWGLWPYILGLLW